MDWKEIIEKLERYIEATPGFISKFPEDLGFPSRYIADIKSGKSKKPSSDFALALITKLGVNPLWLQSGDGDMLYSANLPQKTAVEKTEVYKKVPLLRQKVSCGHGENWEDEQNIKEYIDIFSLIPRLKPERMFALSVQGTSMVGAGIKNGDYVLFNAESDQYLDDGIYVFALDGDVYCKRLEFEGISKKVKIYSVRVTDLEKAELLTTLNIEDANFADRFRIFGRVLSWVHPNFNE